jgi:hypothetical protein
LGFALVGFRMADEVKCYGIERSAV